MKYLNTKISIEDFLNLAATNCQFVVHLGDEWGTFTAPANQVLNFAFDNEIPLNEYLVDSFEMEYHYGTNSRIILHAVHNSEVL